MSYDTKGTLLNSTRSARQLRRPPKNPTNMAQPTGTHSTGDTRLLIRRRVVVSILYYNRRPQPLSRQSERAVPWPRVADTPPFPNADIYVLSHPVGALSILNLYSPTLHLRIKGDASCITATMRGPSRGFCSRCWMQRMWSQRETLPGALARL